MLAGFVQKNLAQTWPEGDIHQDSRVLELGRDATGYIIHLLIVDLLPRGTEFQRCCWASLLCFALLWVLARVLTLRACLLHPCLRSPLVSAHVLLLARVVQCFLTK